MNDTVNGFDMANVNPVINNEIITNILFALVILLIGFAVGKLLGIALFKLLNGVEFDRGFKKISNSSFHASKTLSSLVSWLVYVASVVFALITLDILNITLVVVAYFLGVLVLGTIVLGAIYAVPNLFFKYSKNLKNVKKGDNIKVSNVEGEVVKLNLLSVKLKGKRGEEIHVPNKLFRKNFKKL